MSNVIFKMKYNQCAWRSGKPDAVTNCSVDNRTITAVLISCQVIKLQLPSSGVFLYQHLCCHNKDLILTFNEMLSLSWNHIMNYHHIVFCWWGMESQLTVVFFTNGQNFVRLAPSLVTFTFLSESELKSVEKKKWKIFNFVYWVMTAKSGQRLQISWNLTNLIPNFHSGIFFI